MSYVPMDAVAVFPAGDPLYESVAPLIASEPCRPDCVKLVFSVPVVDAVEPKVFDCAEAVIVNVATVIFAVKPAGCVSV